MCIRDRYQISQALTNGNYTWQVVGYATRINAAGESLTLETGRTIVGRFSVSESLTLGLSVDTAVVNSQTQQSGVTINWVTVGTSPANTSKYKINVYNPISELIFSTELPLGVQSYSLTNEQLKLLTLAGKYTVKLELVDSGKVLAASQIEFMYGVSLNLTTDAVPSGPVSASITDGLGLNSNSNFILPVIIACLICLAMLALLIVFFLLRLKSRGHKSVTPITTNI